MRPNPEYFDFSDLEGLASFCEVDPVTGCWIWNWKLTPTGYGTAEDKILGGSCYVHRIAFEMWWGPIEHGMDVGHLCNVKNCCNPNHLAKMTRRNNVLYPGSRQVSYLNHSKTHCKHGHEFTTENTYVRKHGRICKTCVRNLNHLSWIKIKEKRLLGNLEENAELNS